MQGRVTGELEIGWAGGTVGVLLRNSVLIRLQADLRSEIERSKSLGRPFLTAVSSAGGIRG